jgi:hypothetical protein
MSIMRNRVVWWTLGSLVAPTMVLALGLGAVFFLPRIRAAAPASAPAAPLSLEELFHKATVDGKYGMLLRQIKVEKDKETYQDFKDLGYRSMPEYGDYKDLPAGHWVYAAPYWYIWRDLTSVKHQKRSWGPEQATGEPDTNMAGDIVTAWASASQDGQDEWLMCEYQDFVTPTAVMVYETYNPGALVRVTAFKPDGEEVELWKGTDPTATDAGMGVSEIPVKAAFKTNRVKIYLDSVNVVGWNEIDAVGLRDKNKNMHWATAVEASTTYAGPFVEDQPAVAAPPFVIQVTEAQMEEFKAAEKRLKTLEEEVRQLKETVEELKRAKNKDK